LDNYHFSIKKGRGSIPFDLKILCWQGKKYFPLPALIGLVASSFAKGQVFRGDKRDLRCLCSMPLSLEPELLPPARDNLHS